MLGGCLLLQPLATAETVLPLPAHRTLPAGRGGGYGAARRTADILRALNRQHFYNPLEHNRGGEAGGLKRGGGGEQAAGAGPVDTTNLIFIRVQILFSG
jgi:hypothetical protein